MVFEVLARQTGINFLFDREVKNDGRTTIFVQNVPVEAAIDLVLGQNQLARQVLADNMVLIYPNNAAKQREYQEDLNGRRNEELQQVLEKANKAVKKVAEDEKYDLVIQEVVYSSAKHDITDKVVKILNTAAAK